MFLAAVFAGVAYSAASAGVWVIAGAALVLALWVGTLALRALLANRAR